MLKRYIGGRKRFFYSLFGMLNKRWKKVPHIFEGTLDVHIKVGWPEAVRQGEMFFFFIPILFVTQLSNFGTSLLFCDFTSSFCWFVAGLMTAFCFLYSLL